MSDNGDTLENESTTTTPETTATPAVEPQVAAGPTPEEKRDILRQRIEAGEQRQSDRSLGEYAKDAGDTALEFVKEHPLTAVAAVAGVALLIGAATRPGRRAVRRASGAVSGATATSAAVGGGLLDRLLESARHGGDWLEDRSEDLSRSARSAKRRAAYRGAETQDSLGLLTRRAGRKTGRTLRDLRYRSR